MNSPIVDPGEAHRWLQAINIIEMYTPDVNREYKQFTTPEGRNYYLKISTGEVSWQAPAHFITRQQMANILSVYFQLVPKNFLPTATTRGIPFASPPHPSEAPPVCLENSWRLLTNFSLNYWWAPTNVSNFFSFFFIQILPFFRCHEYSSSSYYWSICFCSPRSEPEKNNIHFSGSRATTPLSSSSPALSNSRSASPSHQRTPSVSPFSYPSDWFRPENPMSLRPVENGLSVHLLYPLHDHLRQLHAKLLQ